MTGAAGPYLQRRWTRQRVSCTLLATWALTISRLELLRQTDPEIVSRLRYAPTHGTASPCAPEMHGWLVDFSWAIQGIAKRAPFRADCLVRVLAARRVLEARGIPFGISIQVGRRDGPFEAHAWLTSCGHEITGGPVAGLATLIDADHNPAD